MLNKNIEKYFAKKASMSNKRMKHQLTQNVKLLQKAVLIHNSKILILQRSQDSQSRPGSWDLPGGNSEWPEKNGEDQNQENMHQEDIAREIKEETGLTVFSQHFTKENLTFFRTFYEATKDVYTIITAFRVEMPSDFERSQIVLSDEHIDHKWINIEDLNEYDFGGKRGEFIKDMIRSAI